MLALRWHGPRDVRLDEVEEPASQPGMSLVEVALCGICGSDLHEYRNGPAMMRSDAHPLTGQAPPLTLGHEFSGRIVGEGGLLPAGTRVTVDACWRCGTCDACTTGAYNHCRLGGSVGLHSDGAFAPLVRVPDYTLVPLPDSVSDEQAALTEPFAVALHALKRGDVAAGQGVTIFGFGPIGAAAAVVARSLGAVAVVVEKSPERREAAEGLGFRTFEASDAVPREIRRVLSRGGADVTLDTTGVPSTVPAAVESLRRGGRAVVIGLTRKEVLLDPTRLTYFERSLIGSLAYQHDLPVVVRMVAERLFDPLAIVADTVALSQAPTVFAGLADHPGARLKVLVDPRA